MAQKSAKITDVKSPGSAVPSASARPIVVTNRPLLANDPMMVGGEAAAEGKSDSVVINRTAKKLEPLNADTDNLPKETAPGLDDAESGSTPQSTVEAENPDKAATPQPISAVESVETTKEGLLEASVNRDPAADASAKETEAEDVKAAREVELEGMIASGKYAVPINAVQRRRTRLYITLFCLLSLILAVLLIDILLDAGFLKLNSNIPHTHLFTDSKVVTTNVPAPVAPARKQYVSSTDGLKFSYPGDWDLIPPTNNYEYVALQKRGTDPTASAINFTRPTSSISRKYQVEYISYRPFTSGKHQLYERQLVYKDTLHSGKSTYTVEADVTDTLGHEKAGDTITGHTATFLTHNGTATAFFVYSTGGGVAVNNLYYLDEASAQNYLSSDTFKQAETILRSISF